MNYAPRRQRNDHAVLLICCTAVIVALAVGFVIYWEKTHRNPDGGSSHEQDDSRHSLRASPDAWSHGELIQHLQAKGLVFTAERHDSALQEPAMNFYFDGRKSESHRVLVRLRKTSQEAKDWAAIDGENGLSWGRFTFRGFDNPKHLDQIRRELP